MSRPRKGSKIYQHGEHFDTVVEVLREDADGEFLVTGTDEGPDLEFFIRSAGKGVWVIPDT
jgi:anti-sigma regulatory factor (Ser/Thr protein kinase)